MDQDTYRKKGTIVIATRQGGVNNLHPQDVSKLFFDDEPISCALSWAENSGIRAVTISAPEETGDYLKESPSYVLDRGRKYVVFDLDGTLSRVGARAAYLKQDPPDWKEFFAHCGEDEAIAEMIVFAKILRTAGVPLLLCTGRSNTCLWETRKWLDEQGIGSKFFVDVLFRDANDSRPDEVVKPELLEKVGYNTKNVLFIVEDRTAVVSEWRRRGYCCIQPFQGDF